jgi:hypothetical protein
MNLGPERRLTEGGQGVFLEKFVRSLHRSCGSVAVKALRPLMEGRGLIPDPGRLAVA